MSIGGPKTYPWKSVLTTTMLLLTPLVAGNKIKVTTALTTPEGKNLPQGAYTSDEEPFRIQSDGLSKLIIGPYTTEGKRDALTQQALDIAQTYYPPKERMPDDIISGNNLDNLGYTDDGIPYDEFVLWRTMTDNQRIDIKDTLLHSIGDRVGWNEKELYYVYQKMSFDTQKWGTNIFYQIDPQVFFLLAYWKETYAITTRQTLNYFVQPPTGNSKSRSPDTTHIYRAGPRKEKTTYGKQQISTTRYDWKTASCILKNNGYRLWSSNEQHNATGKEYDFGDTCTEGMSQELLDGLLLLKNMLAEKTGGEDIFINAATDGAGHGGEEYTTAGHTKKGHTLTLLDSKKHGQGYAVDIRLSGKTAYVLRKFFPGEKGMKTIGGFVYKYYYHGGGTQYHLHLTIFRKSTYKKLFPFDKIMSRFTKETD